MRSVPQQYWPGVHARADQRARGGAVEVGVGADDHRVLAAELERDGQQLAATGLRDLAPGRDAAGERDLVDARLHERGAGLAVAHQDLEHAVGQARLGEELADQRASSTA